MLLTLALALTQSASTPPAAEEARWPQFLGPDGCAVAESRPASLGFDLEQDVLWKTELPPGSSSPCIWGERLFLTAFEVDEYVMLALDRMTGQVLWSRSVPAAPDAQVAHVDARPAAPTPCTDGERVVFYFGAYGLIVCDMEGALLWEKKLPDPQASFGIGSSPVLIDDLLVLSRDGCPDSSILAFEIEDGSERWSVPRAGYTYSFGTPYLWRNAERSELVVAGSNELAALDPATGDELWKIGGLCQFVCTTPVGDDELLYFAAWSTGGASATERVQEGFGASLEFSAEELADGELAFKRFDQDGDGRITVEELPPCRVRDAFVYIDRDETGALEREEFVPMFDQATIRGKNAMIAVAPGGKGDVSESHVRWTLERGLPYVSSPLLHEGRLWLVKSGGVVSCLDPESGELHFGRQRLGDRSEYYATPLGVEGHVILCSNGGTVYVLRSADDFEMVRQVELGARIFATPALVDGTIYLRTDEALWAFGA